MIRFSASDAAVEGFELIRRRWRLVAAWCLVNLAALSALAIAAALIGVLLTFVGAAAAVGAAAGLTAGLGALVAEAVLGAGLFRVMLQRGGGGRLHLRISRDELRLLAVWLITGAAAAIALGVAFSLAASTPEASLLGRALIVLLAAIATAWLALRFSFAGPIAVAEERIDFRASWRLTRGRGWALFGMSILVGCLLALVWLGGSILMVLLLGGITGFHDLRSLLGEASFDTQPVRFLIQAAAQALFAPVLLVLTQAPLAAAYEAIRRGEEPYTPGPWG